MVQQQLVVTERVTLGKS